ncbi:hypothetical protein GMOD_00005944 [Pyrenophora seminiperda CCB06]|uniref:25S rRNA (Uridine(2843)-N(3))-methyltransferase n=1 Tax=Pyrenophora seminiperda CCB06 TaxID=1302712 RepID=A0A3M7MA41_9PLEO|nr:hypothetical protein GMOD_00005944 [Pyrenophora seminiperda CCB06]
MAPNSKLNAKRKAQRESSNTSTSTTNKPRASEQPASDTATTTAQLPLPLQQLVLNIFRNSFAERLSSDYAPLLQEIKGYLYKRDFASAFGTPGYLEVYAARWSASRALGYLDLFWELRRVLGVGGHGESGESRFKVVCLGGGAGAEVVALGGLQKRLLMGSGGEEDEDSDEKKVQKMEITAIDIADWSVVVDSLTRHLTTTPTLSKYASAAAKAANVPFANPDDIAITFTQHDVLQAPSTSSTQTATTPTTPLDSTLAAANLVTLLFTLNELYTTSLASTQALLLHLTELLQPGALLLVVDSPGSYSSVTLNGAAKKYPMHWLLDHTLLSQASRHAHERGREAVPRWEKVSEQESRWFRLDERLQYPIDLENMRMQVHLYRRL